MRKEEGFSSNGKARALACARQGGHQMVLANNETKKSLMVAVTKLRNTHASAVIPR